MKERVIFFLIAIFVFTSGNCVERKNVVNSEDHVRNVLARAGVEMGLDEDKGRMVAIGTGFFAMDKATDETDNSFEWHYDFSDAADDDFETRRFKAMWRAYADGLADIAEGIKSDVDMKCSEVTNRTDEVISEVVSEVRSGVSVKSSIELAGVAYLTMAESMNDGMYAVSVAVGQSKKREECYSRASRGVASTPGKSSLAEWIELDRNSATGIICPQTYCDNEGRWWRIAGVPVDLAAGRNSKKVTLLTERARRYAYEAAIRTIAVRVSKDMQTMKVESKSKNGTDIHLNKMKLTVKIDPVDTVLPVDSSQVRWFQLDRVNPLTGKPVRCVVAALLSGNGTGKLKQNMEKDNARVQQSTAIEQAREFVGQKGWRTGREFLKSSGFAVAIGGASFKCAPMSGVAFAQKRNDAVQLALMEAALNVAFTYDMYTETAMSLSRNGENMHEQRKYVGEEADGIIVQGGITFSDDIDTVVDMRNQDFQWYASLSSLLVEGSENVEEESIKTLGRVKGQMPVCEFRVERQFESIVDGKYQIAFVVTCDPKRGGDTIRSFDREQISGEKRGKLSLQQWIEAQDFGMMAGPRRYVDDKGSVWAIGIAPAAAGCRPFGSSLDGMAREYAAFAFGGEIRATYETASMTGPSGGYLERKATIQYTTESSPAGRLYPREFELMYHRPFEHPLTGCKGEVSICALRSGTREVKEKHIAERIKEERAKKKEQGRKERMRDFLLKHENENRNEE